MRLIRYSDLENEEVVAMDIDEPFNLYLILRGRKITLNKDECKITNDSKIKLSYNIHNKSDISIKELELILNARASTDYELEIEYPYKNFVVKDPNGVVTGGFMPAFLRKIRETKNEHKLPHQMAEEDGYEFLDLELLYVGQSQGVLNDSTVLTRLKNHSTYQQILALEFEENTDTEIYIGLLQMETITNLIAIPNYKHLGNHLPAQTLQTIINSEIFRKESINITEAALIKYFEPKYNSTFVGNFPSREHISYNFF